MVRQLTGNYQNSPYVVVIVIRLSLIATYKLYNLQTVNDLRNNLKSPVYLEGNHELPYKEEK